jgi:hypothetical protein
VRFNETILVSATSEEICSAELVALYDDGDVSVVGRLGSVTGLDDVVARFLREMGQRQSGHLLEVGSRARSGITRRDWAPRGWKYTGLDIMAGPNADIIGDAHELSSVFPIERFDAVMALSVLEHLMMPWKFATELNKVMKPGGIGLFLTHQTWPMHDEPWDFWRFSSHTWTGILNKMTGFRIIDAQMSEPCYMVAEKIHTITNFTEAHLGFLSSVVLFEKIGETRLSWPATLTDLTDTSYPQGEVRVQLP